jgi:hypothetical protein
MQPHLITPAPLPLLPLRVLPGVAHWERGRGVVSLARPPACADASADAGGVGVRLQDKNKSYSDTFLLVSVADVSTLFA